jgi:hypothetical protein
LLLDVYGGILEMAGECFELIALGQPWDRLGVRVVLRGYLWRRLLVPRTTPGCSCGDRSEIHPPGPGERHVVEAVPASSVV